MGDADPLFSIISLFRERIPHDTRSHLLGGLAANPAAPFTIGLCAALWAVDKVSGGYAEEMVTRLANVPGTGEESLESLLQILGEIYVASGAAAVADRDAQEHPLFGHEPGANAGAKNPELESRRNGWWYAVEVKTPKLRAFSRQRTATGTQLTARLGDVLTQADAVRPRDNPIKDFLISAEGKFAAYAPTRPDASRVLVIVWDDFVQEAVTALIHPHNGLLTRNSFHRDPQGNPVLYPHVDAVLLVRYQHQILLASRGQPLAYGEDFPFMYRSAGRLPPKALVRNPQVDPYRQK